MRHKVLLGIASVLVVFAVFWFWPAFHEPPNNEPVGRNCPDSEDYWSYKVTSRTWDCGPTGWHIVVGDNTYGFPGI
jgi:hypothetical protein